MVGWVGSVAVIPWAAIARLAEPNESSHWEEDHSSLSIALLRGTNLSFQAFQFWEEGTRPSHDGRSLGNNFAERTAEVAMPASQPSVIVREVRVAFFCVLSNLWINPGTRGSSSQHSYMVANMATPSAHSSPPLCVASRSRRSFMETRV